MARTFWDDKAMSEDQLLGKIAALESQVDDLRTEISVLKRKLESEKDRVSDLDDAIERIHKAVKEVR
jgi:chromosome segregation ATPase